MSASLFINQRGTTKKTVASIINLYRHHLRSILEQGRELKYDINLAHLNAFYIDNKLATREQLDLWLEEFEPKTTRAQFVENCLISDNQLSKLKADTTAKINDNIRKWMGTKNKPSDMPEEEKKVYEAFILKVKGPIPKTQIINDEIQEITKEEFSDIYLRDIKNYYKSGVRVNRIDSKLKTLEKIVDNQWKLRNADVMAKVANTTPNNAILYDSLVIKVPTTNDFDPTNEQLLAMRDAVSFLTKGYKKLFTAIHRDELVDDKGSHLHECYEAFNPQNCRFDIRTSMFKRTLEYAQSNGIEVNPELLKIQNWSDDKLSCFKHGDEEDDQEVNNKKKKKKKKVDNPLMTEYGKLSQIVIFHAVNAAKIPGLPVFEIRPDNDETKLKIKEQEKKRKKPLPKIKDTHSQLGLALEKAEKARIAKEKAEKELKEVKAALLESEKQKAKIINEIQNAAIEAIKAVPEAVKKISEKEETFEKTLKSDNRKLEDEGKELLKDLKEQSRVLAKGHKFTKFSDQEVDEIIENSDLTKRLLMYIARVKRSELKINHLSSKLDNNLTLKATNDKIEEALDLPYEKLRKHAITQKETINSQKEIIKNIPNQIKAAKEEAKKAAEKERNEEYEKDIKNYQNKNGSLVAQNEELRTENESLKNRNAFIELVAKGFKYVVSELGIKSKVIELSYFYNKEVGDAVLEFLSDNTAPRNDGIGNRRGYK